MPASEQSSNRAMMTKVFIRNATYNPVTIRALVDEMFDSMGPNWIQPGLRVLVKPNLLMAAPPEKAIVTHPVICRAVVEHLLARGARVQVSDSPGVGSFRKILAESGYKDALEGLDVVVKPFEGSVEVDIGEPFGPIPVAQEVMDADLVINLAKLKSHAQMFLTLGVKNIFGCIVGLRKPEWHMRMGVDRLMFSRLIVQIYRAVAPAFTIVDGILALEGQGPGKSGKPRELGLLVGGANGHAVDKTICTLLGLDPNQLLTCAQAQVLSMFDGSVHVNGDIHIVDDFKFPELNSLSIGPESFSRFMRQYVLQKPVVDNPKCKLCGECWKICPAKAISHTTRGVQFDYNLCIRCYCCLEVCPHGAICAKEPLLGKARRRLIGS
ncbi:MAG: DUF362 domain-containing protein [Desulfobacterales bacterium]|nr:DUF362 domain-containing protein [Desulfobacterales bacterium]